MSRPYIEEGNVVSHQSVYELSTQRLYPIGTRGTLGARSFRYARFTTGAAIGPNLLAQMAPPVATNVTETQAAVTAGNSFVDFTPGATDVAQNQFHDGYWKQEGGTAGIGQIYALKAHGFKVQSVATTFDTYDPIVTTSTGTETGTLIANEYSDLVVAPTTITAPAAGIPLINIPASTTTTGTAINPPNGYQTTSLSGSTYTYTTLAYGWVQTWGVCSCLIDDSNVVAGSGLVAGTLEGGLGVAVANDILQRVGVALEAMSTNSIYFTAFLQIAP